MRLKTLVAGIILGGLIATPVLAHVPAQSTELDWHVGFMDYDNDLKDDLFLGAYVARNISEGWGLEGGFGLTPGDDFKGYFAHGNAVYNFNVPTWERFVPFLTAGAGVFSYSPKVGDSSTDMAINFGGGAKAFLTQNLALRGDIRDHLVFSDPSSTNNLQFTAGLTYFIRSAP